MYGLHCTKVRLYQISSGYNYFIIILLFRYFAFESLQVLKVAYSQKVFHFLFNLQKGAKSQSWALSPSRGDAQNRDLAPLFGDLVQNEKLSNIKPALGLDNQSELEHNTWSGW